MLNTSTLLFLGCALSVAMPQALRQAQGIATLSTSAQYPMSYQQLTTRTPK